MGLKLLTIFMGFFISFSESFSSYQYKIYDEDMSIPQSYPIFSATYGDNEISGINSCVSRDFVESCGYDGGCSSRKGVCGEILSGSAFENIDENWERLSSQYGSSHGVDALYKINDEDSSVKYVIVEDKAGEAKLNKKQHQMSLWWQKSRIDRLACSLYPEDFEMDGYTPEAILKRPSYPYPSVEECEEIPLFISTGQVTSFLTHTFYKDTRAPKKGITGLSKGLKNLKLTPLDRERGQTRYKFMTSVSLLISSEWPDLFKEQYIENYQASIHDPFLERFKMMSCRNGFEGFCISQNEREVSNSTLFSDYYPYEIILELP